MGTAEVCPAAGLWRFGGDQERLIVVGVTHPQTCLVLRGRLRALRLAGFRVVVISGPGEPGARIAAEEGVEHCAIPMQRRMSPLADLVSLFRLCAVLRRLRPTIAEFSTPKAGLLGNLAGFLCRIPVRIYVLRGLRLETARGFGRSVLWLCERIATACCHTVVCNSKSLRARALALGIAPLRKLRIIGVGSSSGVDVRHFAPRATPGPAPMRARLRIPPEDPVIGFVGRLTRDKGIPELLEAFESLLASFPKAWLLLAGWFDASEDALSLALRERIASHPRIRCTGFLSDTAPIFHAMDVLVLPTRREGFPNVVLEASASGLPVVSTFATGARDAVRHERTGLLVSPGDSHMLARAIQRLLSSPSECRQMGAAGRRWVADRFVDTRVHGLTVALYRELIIHAERKSAVTLATDVAAAGD